jgi:hypothetical protein
VNKIRCQALLVESRRLVTCKRAIVLLGLLLALSLLTEHASAQLFAPLVRRPNNAIHCWDSPPSGTPDRYRYDVYNATIGGITTYNTTSVPGFQSNMLDGYKDVLNNPGMHYRSAVFSGQGVPFGAGPNLASGWSATIGSTPPRVSSASITVRNHSVVASIADDKTAGPTGAAVLTATYQDTYDTTRFFGNRSIYGNATEILSGVLAFDVVLPTIHTVNPFPGSAAVSFCSRLATDSLLYDRNGQLISDAACFELATVGAQVSEGISDGQDNHNLGPQENLFGNADVGFVTTTMPNIFTPLGVKGNVKITSTPLGTTRMKHHIVAQWSTIPFRPVALGGAGDPTLSFSHTVTMIADPGAEVSLVPLTDEDWASLPQDLGVLVVQSGHVPEPTSAAVFALGIVGLAHHVRRGQRRRSIG